MKTIRNVMVLLIITSSIIVSSTESILISLLASLSILACAYNLYLINKEER